MRHKQLSVKGKYEAMVTESEFKCMQKLLGKIDRIKHQKHYFPFDSGLIKYGECGN